MEIEKQNEMLAEISKTVFGESACLKIVRPKSLKLLTQNARYFKRETFKQLVQNIKADNRLSSVPLCYSPQKDVLEVLSGNHRVKAAIEADIEWILVIVIIEEISKSRRISAQLSHNALVGVDDPNILADLWAKIDDIKDKLYAGLSSEAVKELEQIKLVTFSTPSLATKTVAFLFTVEEKKRLDDIIEDINRITANETFVFPMSQFNTFFRLIQDVKKKDNIKNGSLAMLKIIEVIENYLKKGEDQPLEMEG